MKLTNLNPGRNGKQRCVVELDDDEVIVVVRDGAHYRLGGQVDEIMASHVLIEAVEHRWCSIAQEWVSCR